MAPVLYKLTYSRRVLDSFPLLATRAESLAIGRAFSIALLEIDRRLKIYPEFGQPLMTLATQPGEIWIGCVPPLVVRYTLLPGLRQVWVVIPLALMGQSRPAGE